MHENVLSCFLKEMEDSTKEIVKKAANAVGSLKVAFFCLFLTISLSRALSLSLPLLYLYNYKKMNF